MQQLNGSDAAFYFMESASNHMHVTSVHIYDPSTAADGKVRFKDILAHVESRLHTSKVFRRKLVSVPLNLDYPYWVEDDGFDLEFHIRHIALPAPGDWRQFCIQIARLDARPLDHAKPLWEMYVIEGLDNIDVVPKGSYAIVTKLHHAAVDGATGTEITLGLHDLDPEGSQPATEKDNWRPEKTPGGISLLARAGVNNVRRPLRFVKVLGEATPTVAKMILGANKDKTKDKKPTPWTRFNGDISPHRVFEARSFSLDDVRAMKRAVSGATVNDAVLTICGGALRKYLNAKDVLPKESMTAMAPINVRTESQKGAGGNQLSAMQVQLRTDIEDPFQRLEAVHEASSQAKELNNAIGARRLTEINEQAPAPMVMLAARLATRTNISQIGGPMCNCVITNVPGPQHTLYMNGAKLVYMGGCGPLVDGVGLMIPVLSYDGQITISFTCCRKMIPDPEFFAQCIDDAFEELKQATSDQSSEG